MATPRLPMRQVRQVLRLRFEHQLSSRAIARACAVGLGTVAEYLARARRCGLSWPLPEDLDDTRLEALLFPRAIGSAPKPVPDFVAVHQELKRPGVTLMLLWMEYLQIHPGGLKYSQFCDRYRSWARTLHPSMRQVHRAGEKGFVDFAGQKPTIVDPRTGEIQEVELFLAALGASGLVYAEAVPSQGLAHWIHAHIHAIEEWGGSPEIWVPDNLKSGVTRPCRYEPLINRTYEEMAAHYGAVVIPARVRRPKDKSKVEIAVLLAERWILAVLRNQSFFSLAELNQAIREQTHRINDRLMKKLGVSRRQLFDELDRPALRPLPASRYEIGEWKPCRVSIDYHVELGRNYYSVPYTLVGKQVEARMTATMVEIYLNAQRVTSHRRLFGRGQPSTHPEHRPASHRAHLEWTPSRLIQWAEKNGPATGRMVTRILHSRPHPEQGFRSCLGLLRMAQTYDPARLEAACRRAEHLGSFGYRTVKNILAAGLDQVPFEESTGCSEPLASHENVRGAQYYATQEESGC